MFYRKKHLIVKAGYFDYLSPSDLLIFAALLLDTTAMEDIS